MIDPTKLYAICRDRTGRKKWGVVGSVTEIKGGATELYFETTPTASWGWRAYLFPAGAELPEIPTDHPQQQQQAAPTGEGGSHQ
jgi:hypothetical protein